MSDKEQLSLEEDNLNLLSNLKRDLITLPKL